MKETDGYAVIEKVVRGFKAKPTKSTDFLIESGIKYQYVIFKLCKRIIKDEEIFYLTVQHTRWKMKGPANDLAQNMFLHLKSLLPRTC